MEFIVQFSQQFLTPDVGEQFLRLVIACCCGTVIGLERTKRFKEAGIRTHVIVCCASALLMIVSKYAFGDLTVGADGIKAADGSRIASQVVSGISFLCAGVIIRVDGVVKGLTTAAGLWMTAAIGLTLGSGLYAIGILTSLLVVVFQFVMHRITFGSDSMVTYNVKVTVKYGADFSKDFQEFIKSRDGFYTESGAAHTQETIIYQLCVRTREAISSDVWQEYIREHPYIVKLEHSYVS